MAVLSPLQLEEFLGGLACRKSRASRADAARFIARHGGDIELYIHSKRANGHEELAECYACELAPYLAPREEAGAAPGAVRSFRICRESIWSFTLPSPIGIVRVCGWLLALAALGALLFLAYRVYEGGVDLLERLSEQRMSALRDSW